MRKLRIILLFNLIVLTFVYVYYITDNLLYHSFYDENTRSLEGVVLGIKENENNLQLTVKAKEKVLIKSSNKEIKVGDIVSFEGILTKPANNSIFNQFNYRNYLLSQKIYWIGEGNTSKIDENKVYKFKNNLINYIDSFKSKSYLYTFILGNNDYLSEEAKQSYQLNGISHLFAISGMHITLISDILYKILDRLNKNKKTNFILISIFLLFYIFLTDFSPSIIRAVFMFILVGINKIFGLKFKSLNILIVIACFLLLYNPYYLFDLGFVFSFVITFFLIIFGKDGNYFKKLLNTSIIASVFSIPILINNFFQVNILTVFLNMIFVPLISLFIFPFSLITFLLPFLDNLFNQTVNLMETLSIFLSKFNLVLIFKAIPLSIFILYYIIFYLGFKFKKYHFIIIILLFHTNIKYLDNNSYLTMIDVGQGDSFLLEYKNNKNVLIDTGGNNFSDYNIAKNKLIPYFKSRGIKKLDYLILTHGDADHAKEALNLINDFKVENVIFNNDSYNDLELKIIEELKIKNINYQQKVKKLNIGSNEIQFLNDELYDNENDNSNIVYTKINNYTLLFMGDASKKVESDLLNKYNLNNIDILKVGHHGSKTSSSKLFIESINPKYSLISVGKKNRYGHPNKEILDNLISSISYRTDLNGSVLFKFNTKLNISTCQP